MFGCHRKTNRQKEDEKAHASSKEEYRLRDDALISITWILEFINGALVYWVLLLDMTRKGLKKEKQKETNMSE